jgi:hypothetical protein
VFTRDPSGVVDILLNQALPCIPCLSEEDVRGTYQSLDKMWTAGELFTDDAVKIKNFLFLQLNQLSSREGFEKFMINVLSMRQCVQIKALFTAKPFAGILIWRTSTGLYGCGNSAFYSYNQVDLTPLAPPTTPAQQPQEPQMTYHPEENERRPSLVQTRGEDQQTQEPQPSLLQPCPGCQARISVRASKCPKCGLAEPFQKAKCVLCGWDIPE